VVSEPGVWFGDGIVTGESATGGDTVVDLCDSYKASLAEWRSTALPNPCASGYNDAGSPRGMLLAAGSAWRPTPHSR
jgi:hypothetical protein